MLRVSLVRRAAVEGDAVDGMPDRQTSVYRRSRWTDTDGWDGRASPDVLGDSIQARSWTLHRAARDALSKWAEFSEMNWRWTELLILGLSAFHHFIVSYADCSFRINTYE